MSNVPRSWLVIPLGLLTVWSLTTRAQEIPDPTAAQAGEIIYTQSCAICHGADGESMMPGVPDLIDNAQILDQPDTVLMRRIIDGYQSPGSTLAMPARGGNPSLNEQDVRQVLHYMRQSFR